MVVEVDLAPGLPGFQLVGLPNKPIEESRESDRSALRNSGFRGPQVHVVINLAPADLRKEGLYITRIHAVAGQLHGIDQLQQQRPIRSPHHSCSAAVLLGANAHPVPGR